MLNAYNADYFEESELAAIRSKYKMLTGESKRFGETIEVEIESLPDAEPGSSKRRGRSRTPPRTLDIVKDRELLEDW